MVDRRTVDFGIHLGLEQAEIAVVRGTTVDVIKNNLDDVHTPCAVYVDKRGQVHVGRNAVCRAHDSASDDDVHVQFLRRIGTDHRYMFQTSGRTMRAEDLAAEVLRSLRRDAEQRLGEDILAGVITVPAAYEMRQCSAIHRAAELAGFEQCILLQEPVAAALAYGFQADVTKEYWLVYNFGAGTFDAAIVKAEDGGITVVNHGGDNHLGGSDIDWAIMDQLVIPELSDNYNLPDFRRGNRKWRTALAVIKRAVETAKSQLSRSDTAYLEDCRIRDADGQEVEVDLKLTREAVVNVAEPIISRSVEICKGLLNDRNLTPTEMARAILVGGSTLAPWFRTVLQSSLCVHLDHGVDPLTILARGAAVFAGTQPLEPMHAPEVISPPYRIELKYRLVGPDEDPTVRGEITAPCGAGVSGFSIEFVNRKTHWRSGKVPLRADGRFKVNLLAERGSQNTFTIELLDAKGSKQIAVPDSLGYTIGVAISEQPIINSIGIVSLGNTVDVVLRRGQRLPTKATRVYELSKRIPKGYSGNIVSYSLVEGENARADRNAVVGTLQIACGAIRREIPVGSPIELTIAMDASRILRAKAYIPVLDEEYDGIIRFDSRDPDTKQIERDLDGERRRLNALRKARPARFVQDCPAERALNDISSLLAAAVKDRDAACRAEKRLLDLKVMLDEWEWPDR